MALHDEMIAIPGAKYCYRKYNFLSPKSCVIASHLATCKYLKMAREQRCRELSGDQTLSHLQPFPVKVWVWVWKWEETFFLKFFEDSRFNCVLLLLISCRTITFRYSSDLQHTLSAETGDFFIFIVVVGGIVVDLLIIFKITDLVHLIVNFQINNSI